MNEAANISAQDIRAQKVGGFVVTHHAVHSGQVVAHIETFHSGAAQTKVYHATMIGVYQADDSQRLNWMYHSANKSPSMLTIRDTKAWIANHMNENQQAARAGV